MELGNAKTDSGGAAQDASEDSPFRHFFNESITDGDWKRYILDRPGRTQGLVTPSSLVFDWRLGISQFVYLVTARLAIMGVTDPDFKSTGEHAEELRQYRARLGTLYDLMVGEKMGGEQIAGGIKCAVDAVNLLVGSRPGSLDRTLVRDVAGPLVEPVTVVCADVYTGLATSTTFNEDIRLAVSPIPARQRQCVQDRIDQVTLGLKRVIMTKMPLFHVRAMIDALSVNINGTPDLTRASPKIRTRGIPAAPVFNNSPLCLGQLLVNPNDFGPDDDPERFREAIEQHHGSPGVFICENDATQLWVYDRETGNIRSNLGNCLAPIHDRYGAFLRVLPCKGTPGEQWTYDPESGVLENAFHTVLTVAADIQQFGGVTLVPAYAGPEGYKHGNHRVSLGTSSLGT